MELQGRTQSPASDSQLTEGQAGLLVLGSR